MSQLDLAVATATTQRHVSFLETGRSEPRAEMVHRIAAALRLDPRERNTLLLSAGFAPAYSETSLKDLATGPVLSALSRMVHGFAPYPAVLTRPPGEVLVANAAMDLLYDGAHPELLAEPVNVYRLAIHPEGLSRRVTNFDQWSAHVATGLRDRAWRHPDSGYEALLADLQGQLPQPNDPDVLAGTIAAMRLATPQGEIRLITSRMTLANSDEAVLADLEIEVFLPADEASAAALAAIDQHRTSAG